MRCTHMGRLQQPDRAQTHVRILQFGVNSADQEIRCPDVTFGAGCRYVKFTSAWSFCFIEILLWRLRDTASSR